MTGCSLSLSLSKKSGIQFWCRSLDFGWKEKRKDNGAGGYVTSIQAFVCVPVALEVVASIRWSARVSCIIYANECVELDCKAHKLCVVKTDPKQSQSKRKPLLKLIEFLEFWCSLSGLLWPRRPSGTGVSLRLQFRSVLR